VFVFVFLQFPIRSSPLFFSKDPCFFSKDPWGLSKDTGVLLKDREIFFTCDASHSDSLGDSRSGNSAMRTASS